MDYRGTVYQLLLQWQRGELTERDVHEEAEELYTRFWAERATNAEIPRDDPTSIVGEVLAQLEVLNVGLIVPDDIPAMLAFLDTP